MIETTAEASLLKKFNLKKLPAAGSEWVGKYFFKLWEDARKEKIGHLGLHQRWLDLHALYRGKKRSKKYPRVGVNFIFKYIESYCATLTEKVPIADISADDADDPYTVKAFQKESEEWWNETEQQANLHSSVKDMMIFGTTIEKGGIDQESGDPLITVLDDFNCFPCPGFKKLELDKLPYFCEISFLYDWEIRKMFGVPDNITIPADADEQVAGTIRETTRGGAAESESGRHYPSNYAPIQEQGQSEQLKDKTMVVEIWIRDNSIAKEPIKTMQQQTDDLGRPVGDPAEVETGEFNEYPAYPDGIRKVTICPALLHDTDVKGVLDDSINPNINWNLLSERVNVLVETGVPQPVVDQATGQPVVDPNTGQPAIQMISVPPEDATSMIMERAKICYPLWGKFPYSAVSSREDSSQWWGFSII
ncbi:MAG TPA: hypothetical protein DDY86_03590, partial [Syntrophaceae bacterium]|nr:hypothetical protein [Syntrophaceae bacterium]